MATPSPGPGPNGASKPVILRGFTYVIVRPSDESRAQRTFTRVRAYRTDVYERKLKYTALSLFINVYR